MADSDEPNGLADLDLPSVLVGLGVGLGGTHYFSIAAITGLSIVTVAAGVLAVGFIAHKRNEATT